MVGINAGAGGDNGVPGRHGIACGAYGLRRVLLAALANWAAGRPYCALRARKTACGAYRLRRVLLASLANWAAGRPYCALRARKTALYVMRWSLQAKREWAPDSSELAKQRPFLSLCFLLLFHFNFPAESRDEAGNGLR